MKEIPELEDWEIIRFWSNYTVVNDCWIWNNRPNKGGRALFKKGQESFYASRVAYKLHFGTDPEILHVCHTCDDGMCVNPEHLFLGDDKVNLSDMSEKGRNRKDDDTDIRAHLTAEEVKMIRESSLSNNVLAEQLGVASATVSLARTGKTYKHVNSEPSASPCTNKPALNEKQVREIRLSPTPARQLAREYSVDKNTISKIQSGKSYEQFPWTDAEKAVERKPKPGNTVKFTEEKIAEARKLKAQSWTNAELAEKYGVSRSLISIRLKGTP